MKKAQLEGLNKCYIEFQNCDTDYDCVSCDTSKKFWEEMHPSNTLMKINRKKVDQI